MRIFILDSTLHDGAISFGLEDTLAIIRRLDDFGIDYIDVGTRDREFFAQTRNLKLKHARLTASGRIDDLSSMQALLEAGTPAVCISAGPRGADPLPFLEELKRRGREVIFNAEHFFTAYESEPQLALQAVEASRKAGAGVICLCDTSGGMLPSRVAAICSEVKQHNSGVALGIHAHNDGDLAVANSIAAVEHGFTHVQGCFNGYGERCGCANLSSILPNLELKAGCATVGRQKLEQLNSLAHFIARAANVPLRDDLPFVGSRAEAGCVGNDARLLVNRMPDRLAPALRRELLDKIRRKAEEGYDLASADGTFELLVRESSHPGARPFTVLGYEVVASGVRTHAEVTLESAGAILNGAAFAADPIHALNMAMRQALGTIYASLGRVELVDYRVHGRRVLIGWSDGVNSWTTAGNSENIIEASWLALLDEVHLEILRSHAIPAPVPDYAWAV